MQEVWRSHARAGRALTTSYSALLSRLGLRGARSRITSNYRISDQIDWNFWNARN